MRRSSISLLIFALIVPPIEAFFFIYIIPQMSLFVNTYLKIIEENFIPRNARGKPKKKMEQKIEHTFYFSTVFLQIFPQVEKNTQTRIFARACARPSAMGGRDSRDRETRACRTIDEPPLKRGFCGRGYGGGGGSYPPTPTKCACPRCPKNQNFPRSTDFTAELSIA